MNKRERIRGRKESGSFVRLPHACMDHINFTSLSPYALKLLIDLYAQYRGNNNGDLCCTWAMMKKRGWKSQDTLSDARKELLYTGWILCTQHGGRNIPSLYAVTFQAIDDCNGKLDVKETPTSPGDWKEPKELSWKEYKQKKSLVRNVVQLNTAGVSTKWEKPSFTVELIREAY